MGGEDKPHFTPKKKGVGGGGGTKQVLGMLEGGGGKPLYLLR